MKVVKIRLLKIYTIIFSSLLVVAPLIVMGDQNSASSNNSVFGLHPNLIKSVFWLCLTVIGFFLTRTLIKVDKNLAVLFDNQRKLTVTIAQIVTAHNINHKQNIELPSLSDSNGSAT